MESGGIDRMNHGLRIGLVLPNGPPWLGGSDYIKNLALALGTLSAETKSQLHLSLIAPERFCVADHEYLPPVVSEVLYLDKHLPVRSFKNRLRWKLRRKFFGAVNPRFSDFLRDRFDFVYPYLRQEGDDERCRFAAWIPDFQHKHLPEFFSRTEIQERDDVFERTARTSSVVVLSSRSAQRDFENFFPWAGGDV
jgi:hypothetical protein